MGSRRAVATENRRPTAGLHCRVVRIGSADRRAAWGLAMAVAIALITGAADAHGQALEVRPTLLFADGINAGVRFRSDVERTGALIGSYPRTWRMAVRVDAPILLDRRNNPEPMMARLDLGGLVSLFRPSVPVDGIPTPEDPPPWNRGFLTAQITVGAEAPQDFHTADVTVGAALEYGHDQYDPMWFVPEVRIAWEALLCVDCATDPDPTRNQQGTRLHGAVSWNIPADRAWVLSFLRPVWVRLEARAFTTSGLTNPVSRAADGIWGNAEVVYRCDNCGPIHELYVRGQSGTLSIQMQRHHTVTAGLGLTVR